MCIIVVSKHAMNPKDGLNFVSVHMVHWCYDITNLISLKSQYFTCTVIGFMYMWKCFLILHRFLQGCCAVNGCTLSHDVGPEKMPTCKYFLEGCCVRDGCPYLHVKVNEKAGICKDFLHGYCFDGQKVSKTISYLNSMFIAMLHLQVTSLYLS